MLILKENIRNRILKITREEFEQKGYSKPIGNGGYFT